MAGARGTPTWGTRKRRIPSRCSCATYSAACATQSEPGTSISTARGPETAKVIVRAPVLMLATGAFATLVASCKDSTGPRPAVTVTVASLAGPSYSADSAGQQLIQCDATLQARNPGSQGATWMTATFAFYPPDGSTSAFAVDTVPAETVASSWGAPSIGPGATQTARWSVEGSIPFVLKIRFSYHMGGGAADARDRKSTV